MRDREGLSAVKRLRREPKPDATGGGNLGQCVDPEIASARERTGEGHPVEVGLACKLGNASTGFRDGSERLHKKARVVIHLLDRGVQVGGDVLGRLEVVSSPVVS